MKRTIFEIITGTARIPISVGIRVSEYFPKTEEYNPGKINEMVVSNVKNVVIMPIKIAIFDIK